MGVTKIAPSQIEKETEYVHAQNLILNSLSLKEIKESARNGAHHQNPSERIKHTFNGVTSVQCKWRQDLGRVMHFMEFP